MLQQQLYGNFGIIRANMRDGEEPDAQIGVTVADDVRLQHSSEIKQADVSSWSCRSTCSKVYNYALAQWVRKWCFGLTALSAAGCWAGSSSREC